MVIYAILIAVDCLVKMTYVVRLHSSHDGACILAMSEGFIMASILWVLTSSHRHSQLDSAESTRDCRQGCGHAVKDGKSGFMRFSLCQHG